MIYTAEVKHMCPFARGRMWPGSHSKRAVGAGKQIKDISGFTHGVGWCTAAGRV